MEKNFSQEMNYGAGRISTKHSARSLGSGKPKEASGAEPVGATGIVKNASVPLAAFKTIGGRTSFNDGDDIILRI